MKFLIYIVALFPVILFSQVHEIEQDTTSIEYLIIEGDSIPRRAIDLDEVMLLHKLEFGNREERIRYLILRRKTIKVYPYAKMAAERLDSMNTHLKEIGRRNVILKKFKNLLKVSFLLN